MQQKEVIRASARFVCFTRSSLRCSGHLFITAVYDAVSDVVESGGQWRSDFQIGFRVLKIVINLFLCISMAYNVISCIEVAEITQTLKIADFNM